MTPRPTYIVTDEQDARRDLAQVERLSELADEVLVPLRRDVAILQKPEDRMNGHKDATNTNGRSHKETK